ncbi:MAG: universal stress protein [Dyella sp.]|nr:universal stress protein [Dyella sp.]
MFGNDRELQMTAIVLAMDGSAYSRHAASWLASTTSLAQPLIVHVVHVSPIIGRTGFSAVDFEKENREEARVVFESARHLLEGRVSELHEHWLRGNAAEEVIRFANEHDADLIVVGAKGVGALRSTIIGSVVSKVAAQSAVPVLIVNAKDLQG